jgi:hypothetical protein
MRLKVSHANVEIEVEGKTHKDIFRELQSAEEVFSDGKCGACGGTDTRFVVRKVDDPDPKSKKTYEYFEKRCMNPKCKARLAYGQHNEGGTLFPKRKDDKGNWLPNKGWEVYKPKQQTKGKDEESPEF